MPPIRAVIFDLGHTLWDYAPTEQARRLGTLRLHARLVDELGDTTPHPRELERALLRQLERTIAGWYADDSSLEQPTSDQFVRQALTALEVTVSDSLVADVTQVLFGSDLDVPLVLPDTLWAIATLHCENILMGCITNTIALPSAIDDLLSRLGCFATSTPLSFRVPSAIASRTRRSSSVLSMNLGLPQPRPYSLVTAFSTMSAALRLSACGQPYAPIPARAARNSARPSRHAVIARLSDLPSVLARLSA